MLNTIIKSLLRYPVITKKIVRCALQMHNFSYSIAGAFSQCLEPDGLHPKHRLIKYHQWFTDRIKPHWRVLDIGCGNGALTYDLREKCSDVVGIDINETNIQKAESRFSKEGITYICGDATKYKFAEKFDAFILSNVLEHIEHRVDFLRNIYINQDKQQPPVLLLRVPMITRGWITLYKKEMGIEWRLDKTHFTEYTLEELENELKQAGLEIQSFDIQFGEFYGVLMKTG
jgi:SAM-dependent methyltransferase